MPCGRPGSRVAGTAGAGPRGTAAARCDAPRHGRRSERRGDHRRARDGGASRRRSVNRYGGEHGRARHRRVRSRSSRGVTRFTWNPPGFEPQDVRGIRIRSGDNAREVKLAIARVAETVQVGRDLRERGTDPRGDAFASVLGPEAINELPDDPDEMERELKEMAGPGAVMRVNGFRGGKLPPKDQIAQIRFIATCSPRIRTRRASSPWTSSRSRVSRTGEGATNAGFRDSAFNARNAFAPAKGDERNQRYGFSSERTDLEEAHVARADRHRRECIRRADDFRRAALRRLCRLDSQTGRYAEPLRRASSTRSRRSRCCVSRCSGITRRSTTRASATSI